MVALSVPPKVTRLVPLLASEVDGEVLATVAAIGRVLQSAGLTFADLASALAQAPPAFDVDAELKKWAARHAQRHTTEAPTPERPAPEPTHRQNQDAEDSSYEWAYTAPESLRGRIEWCVTRMSKLKPVDRTVVAALWGDLPHSRSPRTEPVLSPVQREQLDTIVDKLEGRERRAARRRQSKRRAEEANHA